MQKEINKLLKRISAEKLKNNNKECIELYNIVGGLYSDIGSYDEAIHYHEKALELSKTLGDRLNTALCFRHVGEAKASLGQFYQAIDLIKKYLDLAQKENDMVEVQRAWTTLGRVYLMQAQDMKDNSNVIDNRIKEVAREAEKRFQQALNLAESLREQVGEKEFLQMSSGLLVNIGLIKDICGQHTESVQKLHRAIEMCKSAKLKEDLYRCQAILASLYRLKFNIGRATKVSEEALVTAKQIGKKLLICDAYIERGMVKLWQKDFREAKRSFAQAYLEKSPSEEDHSKAIRLTKLAYLISNTFDKVAQNTEANETRMKLCDKLGDLFVAVGCFKLAVEFYKRAFTDARICSRPKNELAKILYSVAETYADDGQFEHARVCYEKELSYRNGNDSEQCQTLIKIAQMREYMDQDAEIVCKAYEKAYEKAGKDPKLRYNVLKDYVPYMKKKSYNLTRCSILEEILTNVGSYPDIMAQIEQEGEEEANDLEDEVANVDDIITDDEDNDEVLMVGRRRARGTKKFKPNEVGDTPLHEACIKGDLKRVKSLLEQGHEVNPRDNAGWIPLHEACNHGHYEIAECLIENGADVCNRGLKGMSPLHDAATNGHYDIMRLLIRNGANVIALTDAGETVLSCLRDFKKRNNSAMSNRDQTEYKHMETELMNLMDKCGFNLMDATIRRTSGGSDPKPSTSFGASASKEPLITARPRSDMRTLTSDPISNPVKDYRAVIGTLKRKRLVEEPKENDLKRANLPATYSTGANTSVATKDWLIDDVSRKQNIMQRRSKYKELLESDDEFEEQREEEEQGGQKAGLGQEEDEVELIEATQPSPGFGELPAGARSSPITPPAARTCASDEDVLIVSEQNFQSSLQFSDSSSFDLMRPASSLIEDWPTRTHHQSSTTTMPNPQATIREASSSGFGQLPSSDLIEVLIEDHQMLIQNTDPEVATIQWLKEAIETRYATLHGVRPNLNLSRDYRECAPKCVYFDMDLCDKVIRGPVRAEISSWKLEPIAEAYEKNCVRLNIEPCTCIKTECKLAENKNLLDLSWTYWPREHVKPVMDALSWRDFTHVNMVGAHWIMWTASDGKEALDALRSWRKVKSLTLRVFGVFKCHFKIMCAMKFPELESLDLRYNGVAFKDKDEFKGKIEELIQGCPKLKKLDMRNNLLKFAVSLPNYSSENFDLAKALKIQDADGATSIEILGGEQNDVEVYTEE